MIWKLVKMYQISYQLIKDQPRRKDFQNTYAHNLTMGVCDDFYYPWYYTWSAVLVFMQFNLFTRYSVL